MAQFQTKIISVLLTVIIILIKAVSPAITSTSERLNVNLILYNRKTTT